MSMNTAILNSEHIDLLVTASVRWRILTTRTAAAFTSAESHLVVGTPTEAGRLLQQENLAAVRWLASSGRARLADQVIPAPYAFTPVEHLVPVEVIKACHAAESLCAAAPGWPGSAARRLLSAVAAAATHRLEGYSAAPWRWTRPHRRSGGPVAAGGAWRPDLPGISWVDVGQLRHHWGDASLVVITAEVAALVPGDLPARSGMFLLAGTEPQDEIWEAITALGAPALVLFWPACEPWLSGQVTDPAPGLVEHRQEQR